MRFRIKKPFILLILTLYFDPPAWASSMSPAAFTYLQQAISIIKDHALAAEQFHDWASLEKQALNKAGNAQTYADTYPAIRLVLASLQDKQNTLLEPSTSLASSRYSKKNKHHPVGRFIAHHIAYVEISGGMVTESLAETERYAHQLNALIVRLYRKRPVGWIIDLRQASPQNGWPLLAATGLLFDNPAQGTIKVKSGTLLSWKVKAGEAWLDNKIHSRQKISSNIKRNQDAPYIAVLSGPGTSKAGEVLAHAFKGQQKTRFFGQDTAGCPDFISRHVLQDGASLSLRSGTFMDSKGQYQLGKINPDILVAENQSSSRDQTVAHALDWMLAELETVVDGPSEGIIEKDEFLGNF